MSSGRATLGGLLLALVSAATFGTSGSFAGALLDAGWSPGAAVTTRIGLAAVFLTVPALIQLRGRWILLRRNLGLVVIFGLAAVAAAQLFFFLSVERVPVGVAILLEYSGVLLVVGWLWWRGQRPGPLTLSGAVVAMVGLVLVLDLLGAVSLDPIGVLWGLLAAVGLATYFVISGRADSELPPLVLAWAGMLVAAVALLVAGLVGVLPLRAATGDVELAGLQVSWLVPVLGLSVVAAAIAYVTGVAAVRLLGSRVASFVGLTEVLFAVLFAWLLLSQTPTAVQAVGGLLVLAGVALVRADDHLAVVPEPVAAASARPRE
ncbi:MAG: DMT family transporter [Actinomycetota bacterium]|nr:DMT family transporter [Actinomycetota bacterium]